MTGMAPTFPVSSVGARNSLSSQLCKSAAQTHTQHPAKEYQLGSGNRSTCLRVCLRINIMYCVYTHAGTAYTQAFSTQALWLTVGVVVHSSLSICLSLRKCHTMGHRVKERVVGSIPVLLLETCSFSPYCTQMQGFFSWFYQWFKPFVSRTVW